MKAFISVYFLTIEAGGHSSYEHRLDSEPCIQTIALRLHGFVDLEKLDHFLCLTVLSVNWGRGFEGLKQVNVCKACGKVLGKEVVPSKCELLWPYWLQHPGVPCPRTSELIYT